MSSVTVRWRARLAARERLLAAARRELRRKPTGSARAKVAKRERQVSEARRVIARHTPRLTDTVAFDGVPMFRGLALMLADARTHGWHGTVASADRRKGVAERYGLRSQAALYAGWVARRQGFNPANPPGRSTHELRSDGVAYRGPAGRPLLWWQLGLDCSDTENLRAILVRLGYAAFRPYPDGREAHHVNLKHSPTATLRKRGLA
jgi:hypothetical protein